VSLEPVCQHLDVSTGYKQLTRCSSTPSMLTTKIEPPPRCFGDQFKDSFPYIDSVSQDTLNFVANLPEDNKETTTSNAINSQVKEHNEDERLFRDLIRNYNPPFSLKVNSLVDNSYKNF
jgi:hypothetical protein